MKRCGLMFLTFLSLVICPPSVASAAPLNQAIFIVDSQSYIINGSVFQMDAVPFVEQDRVLIPLRYLVHALGLDEKNVVWDTSGRSVELRSADKKIKLIVDNRTYYVNDKSYRMDIAPVLKDDQVFLPARWVVEALGYSTGWNEKMSAVLIGPPGNLPDPESIPSRLVPVKVRQCEFSDPDLWFNQKLSSSAILFHGEYANVYNAGVAAKYVNGFILEPGKEFSFNKVVGERTTQRGFITGFDILDNLTVGGGAWGGSKHKPGHRH